MNHITDTLLNLIKSKRNWNDLNVAIISCNKSTSNKKSDVNDIFILFVKHHLLISDANSDYKDVWLFEELSSEMKDKLGITTIDCGVDLVIKKNDESLHAVRCIFKHSENENLNWEEDKLDSVILKCPEADGYIFYSNTIGTLTPPKIFRDKCTFVLQQDLQNNDVDVIEKVYLNLVQSSNINITKHEPKDHQNAAISKCVEYFKTEDRGQLILPCGAGKTITTLWVNEALGCKNTLMLVPSLALLRQTKNEWNEQRKIDYEYICVCSEIDIDNNNTIDDVFTSTYEIDSNVTTDAIKINSFITNNNSSNKVIFSTYQSIQSIIDSIKDTSFQFDLIICDEAHKTAGKVKNMFSLVHDNSKIPSKKRLYTTATPRIFDKTINKISEDKLVYLCDMNDPEVFGNEIYRMSFKEAIDKGILTDYQLIVVGSDYLQPLNNHNKNISTSDKSKDKPLHNHALAKIMDDYKASHALTFHSRVKYANEFSQHHGMLFENVESFSVNGNQSSGERKIILDKFKTSPKAVVSNARCLTEGIDVPAIDMVFFSDPKNSKVDIVQAVGRALRKKDNKKMGYIVVPLFHSSKDTIEKSIQESSFKNLIQVVRSLCENDERLQQTINTVALNNIKNSISKNHKTIITEDDNQNTIVLEDFNGEIKKSLFEQIIVETSTNKWEVNFEKFKEFSNNNTDYPSMTTDSDLYEWVNNQRKKFKAKTLQNERIEKLKGVGFKWGKDEKGWDESFMEVKNWIDLNKKIPTRKTCQLLFYWIISQTNKYKKGQLTSDEIEKLKSIGCDLDKNRKDEDEINWMKKYIEYKNFKNSYGREPSLKYKDETRLIQWVKNQRSHYAGIIPGRKPMSEKRIKYLDIINFQWSLDKEKGKGGIWDKNFERLKLYINDKFQLNIPQDKNHEDYNLNDWYKHQRDNFKTNNLHRLRIEKFKSIGLISYDVLLTNEFSEWLIDVREIADFVKNEGRYPMRSEVKRHYLIEYTRKSYKEGTLPKNKKQFWIEQGLSFD